MKPKVFSLLALFLVVFEKGESAQTVR